MTNNLFEVNTSISELNDWIETSYEDASDVGMGEIRSGFGLIGCVPVEVEENIVWMDRDCICNGPYGENVTLWTNKKYHFFVTRTYDEVSPYSLRVIDKAPVKAVVNA